jgi:muramoyltetrapeptide carboxypeptidase
MMLIRPRALKPGDTVALLSPASCPKDPAHVRRAREALQALGLQVRLGKHVLSVQGYLAGTDRQRAADLQEAFSNPEVRAIFCTRGGYGAARLLEHFKVQAAVRHPKILVGYSDLTTLHLALQAGGLVSFWGPMPGTSSEMNLFSSRHLKRALFSNEPLGLMPPPRRAWVLHPGQAEGKLTGGTLTLLCASLGTPYEVQTRERIVFLEDVGEEPYKVDRMLTHLLAAGKLKDAAGLVLGKFKDCAPKNYPPRRSLTLNQVLEDRLEPLAIPVFGGLALGHTSDQLTLPYGVRARLDASSCRLEILEAALC